MDKALFYIQVWLAAAISASTLHHFAQLSNVTNQASAIIFLACALLWFGAFVADERLTKWQGVNLESFRFAMIALAAAVVVGLVVPQLPSLFGLLGG
jgi:hypothetical protein